MPWASPFVTVKKPSGAIQLCVDYKRLNTVTGPAPYYMPTVEDALESLTKAKIISMIDLNKGYYQVQVCERDIPKTAFVCKDGHFELARMPFGLKNAPAAFQNMTSRIMAPCREFVVPYIDNIGIFSGCGEDHLRYVEEVLAILRSVGLTISPRKCKWGGQIVDFLRHWCIPRRRVEAIETYRKPRTKKQLRAFLGVVIFYRSYMEILA